MQSIGNHLLPHHNELKTESKLVRPIPDIAMPKEVFMHLLTYFPYRNLAKIAVVSKNMVCASERVFSEL